MRKIEEKMLAWLDEKLKDHGGAQAAIERKDPRSLFLFAAQVCEGIRESGGNNSGPMVELIQETIGGKNKEPWCMSFVQTLIAYCEVRTGIESQIYPSEHCLTVWNMSPKAMRVKFHPLAGAIPIWKKGQTQSGHTGVLESCDEKQFSAIEGNTEKGIRGGKVQRDGGGVYRTLRSKSGDGTMRVVGFLKPW